MKIILQRICINWRCSNDIWINFQTSVSDQAIAINQALQAMRDAIEAQLSSMFSNAVNQDVNLGNGQIDTGAVDIVTGLWVSSVRNIEIKYTNKLIQAML